MSLLRLPWRRHPAAGAAPLPDAARPTLADVAAEDSALADALPHLEETSAHPAPRSLFGEILDWMLAPLLLLWPMSIAVTYLVAKSIANGPFDRALEASAIVLSQQVREVNGRVTLQLPLSAREILRADETDNIYYQVVGRRGEYVAGDHDLPLPPEEEQGHAGLVSMRDDRVAGNDVRVAYTYVDLKNVGGNQPVLVQVAETLDKRARLANEIIKGVILPQFVILPLAVVLVWFGLTRGLAPLTAIQQRIRSRNPGDTSPIDERAAPQEITPLVASFNDLLAQLDQSVQTQKRFIADAAHQMKTPLAGLRMQAELAQREQSPEELRRSLAQIAGSSERTAHLVTQLLSLARMENLAGAGGMAPLDLAALARDVVKDWLPQAWARNIDLGLEADDHPVMITGNRLMLTEMLNNLVDNAIRYSPAGGHATVRVRSDAFEPFAYLDVEDTGPGIAPSERERVMERFYRVLGTNTEGSGLGLAIVREIVQQHGGEVTIDDNVYQASPRLAGARLRITLRRTAPEENPA
ncbi:sensor histidine kinase [Cupriavidus sp.]|jgi:two-component system, OmpR family, sensor histidine kinase TctE|uniref:sensor histidine kinase n=1 Tax=Cupriavidus sp. TaxID=1873897 RepID=UPI0025BD1330|nr:sensor histidine kinase [Cupriavidus sp.]MCA3190241.1 sensor histidine kinase N-terminal domain-containing protein [Cupriavidus sp.]MCA3196945.1 sensor histidine kinase N-terminal domain-containing protein [Cupriavidus sp.]MCA3202222.1 sensor histidine kinase N-terminal domain-containing protein [Cupriavidus sp.]MCA3208206.1 sensor histidine kinase N-terminal domain-containing protein [Cupriavidus sp.]